MVPTPGGRPRQPRVTVARTAALGCFGLIVPLAHTVAATELLLHRETRVVQIQHMFRVCRSALVTSRYLPRPLQLLNLNEPIRVAQLKLPVTA